MQNYLYITKTKTIFIEFKFKSMINILNDTIRGTKSI